MEWLTWYPQRQSLRPPIDCTFQFQKIQPWFFSYARNCAAHHRLYHVTASGASSVNSGPHSTASATLRLHSPVMTGQFPAAPSAP